MKQLDADERVKAILDSLTKEDVIAFFSDAGFEVSDGKGFIIDGNNEKTKV
jgi:hypothetical protein